MNTNIFKTNVSTPYGIFQVAVDSTEYDAKKDIVAAILSDFPCHKSQLSIGEVVKSNRRITANMETLKKCTNYQVGQWAWIKKI